MSKELPISYFKGSQVEILSYDCELRFAFNIANSADHGEMQCPQRFNWVFTVDQSTHLPQDPFQSGYMPGNRYFAPR